MKEAAFFEMSWLPNKDQFSPKGTPPIKNSNQKSASETICDSDNSEVASGNSMTSEVRDVLSQILREGTQKMLQTAIQQEVDEYLQDRAGIVGEDGR